MPSLHVQHSSVCLCSEAGHGNHCIFQVPKFSNPLLTALNAAYIAEYAPVSHLLPSHPAEQLHMPAEQVWLMLRPLQ